MFCSAPLGLGAFGERQADRKPSSIGVEVESRKEEELRVSGVSVVACVLPLAVYTVKRAESSRPKPSAVLPPSSLLCEGGYHLSMDADTWHSTTLALRARRRRDSNARNAFHKTPLLLRVVITRHQSPGTPFPGSNSTSKIQRYTPCLYLFYGSIYVTGM